MESADYRPGAFAASTVWAGFSGLVKANRSVRLPPPFQGKDIVPTIVLFNWERLRLLETALKKLNHSRTSGRRSNGASWAVNTYGRKSSNCIGSVPYVFLWNYSNFKEALTVLVGFGPRVGIGIVAFRTVIGE